MFNKLRNAITNRVSCLEAMVMETGSMEELFEDTLLSEAAKEDADIDTSAISDSMLDVDDVESEDKIEDDIFGTVIFPDNKKEIEELVNKIPDDAPKQPKHIDDEIKKELDKSESHEHVPTVDELNDDEDEELSESTSLLDEIMRRL